MLVQLAVELVKKLITLDPAIIRIFDNNETGLFDFEKDVNCQKKSGSLLGDIEDKDRLIMAMDAIDIVFHTSALKHVPLCEFNPFDAVKTMSLAPRMFLKYIDQ